MNRVNPHPPGAGDTARVLIVDGSTDEREMYAEYFRLRGLATLQADNADDGFRLAVTLGPSVVITVERLLGTDDGLTLTQCLKSHNDTRHTPVIVLTVDTRESNRKAAETAGCDRLVLIPCRPDVLAALVEDLLDDRLARY